MTNTQPLTDKQLDQIEARHQAATPGPWGAYTFGGDTLIEIAADLENTGTGYRARREICRLEDEPMDNDPTHREWTEEEDWAQVQADAEFIAHTPQDVAALLAEVRRLRDELAATGSERDCLAMAVLFARQRTPEAPMSLRDGLDEILATMPSPPACRRRSCRGSCRVVCHHGRRRVVSAADELTAAAGALESLARKAQQDVASNDYWSGYNPATAWRDGLTNGMGGASGDLAAALPPEAVLELSRWLRSAARDAREIGPDPHALAVARALTL